MLHAVCPFNFLEVFSFRAISWELWALALSGTVSVRKKKKKKPGKQRKKWYCFTRECLVITQQSIMKQCCMIASRVTVSAWFMCFWATQYHTVGNIMYYFQAKHFINSQLKLKTTSAYSVKGLFRNWTIDMRKFRILNLDSILKNKNTRKLKILEDNTSAFAVYLLCSWTCFTSNKWKKAHICQNKTSESSQKPCSIGYLDDSSSHWSRSM